MSLDETRDHSQKLSTAVLNRVPQTVIQEDLKPGRVGLSLVDVFRLSRGLPKAPSPTLSDLHPPFPHLSSHASHRSSIQAQNPTHLTPFLSRHRRQRQKAEPTTEATFHPHSHLRDRERSRRGGTREAGEDLRSPRDFRVPTAGPTL